MKKWIYTGLFLLTSAFTPISPLYSLQKQFDIHFPFIEDGRLWRQGCNEEDQLVSVTEYYLEGETKDNWSELVTMQYFISRYNFTLDTLFENVIRDLAKTHPGNKVQSRIIQSFEDSLTASWWITDRSANDQYEWFRIFKKNNHVGILRYTTKRMAQATVRGKVWESILINASFE